MCSLVPVKVSWTLAIWLPDVSLLPPVLSVETWASCMNLTPQHQTGDRTRRRRTLCESKSSWSFYPVPSSRALWAPARGVSHPLGVGEGIHLFFWMWCQVLTLLLDHGGKHAAKKRFSKFQSLLISHVRHRILLDFLQRGGFLVVFLVAVTELWQQRCFWYVVRTQIDLGCWSTVFLKPWLPFMELWVELMPLFTRQSFCSAVISQLHMP